MKELLLVWITIIVLCFIEGFLYTKNEDEL